MTETDTLILGQGIAGTCLALKLEERGASFLIADAADEYGSSWAAGGLVHPLVFKRLTFAWPGLPALESALGFYRVHAGSAWRELGLFRRFGGDFERGRWQECSSEAAFSGVLEPLPNPESAIYGRVLQGGHLEAVEFLRSIRQRFEETETFIRQRVAGADLDLSARTLRTRNGQKIRWRRLVLATGIQSAASGLAEEQAVGSAGKLLGRYRNLSYYGVKGELADLHLPGLSLPGAVLGPVFVLPLAEPGLFRIGSSYEREYSDANPSRRGLRVLCEDAAKMLPEYSVEELEASVVRRAAGIRPATRDRRPYLGPMDPENSSVYCFNGLGTRGFLLAPWLAGLLADHLVDAAPLPEELAPRWRPQDISAT